MKKSLKKFMKESNIRVATKEEQKEIDKRADEHKEFMKNTICKEIRKLRSKKINALDEEFNKLFKKDFSKGYCPFKKKYLSSYFVKSDFYFNFGSNFVVLFYFLLNTYYNLCKTYIDFREDKKTIERALKAMRKYIKTLKDPFSLSLEEEAKLDKEVNEALSDVMKILNKLWF